jgi:hypothetical protein
MFRSNSEDPETTIINAENLIEFHVNNTQAYMIPDFSQFKKSSGSQYL